MTRRAIALLGFVVFLVLLMHLAYAQVPPAAGNVFCTGTASNGQVPIFTGNGYNCTPGAGGGGTPGGTSGQTQYNNGGAFGGYTPSGDWTIVPSTGVNTLATVNANTGSFGGTNSIPSFTVNAKGLITGAASNTPAIPFSEITGQATLAQLPSLPARDVYCNSTSSSAVPVNCQSPGLHSLDYGAVGNGSTDDTTALQTWLDACGTATGAPICYLDQTSSCYKTVSTLTISHTEQIVGTGQNAEICPSSTTTDGIQVTASAVLIYNIEIIPSAVMASHSCIHVGLSGLTSLVKLVHVQTSGFNCFNFAFMDQANAWVMDNVSASASNYAIEVNYGGDSSIINGDVINGEVAGLGFIPTGASAGGGLRVINNKFNTAGGTEAILLSLGTSGNPADWIVANNSIEGYTTGAVLNKGSGTGFANIQFLGNQFVNGQCLTTDSNSGWLVSLIFNDNFCAWSGSNPGVAINAAAVNFDIRSNNFNGLATSTQPAVTIASGATGGIVSTNTVYNDTDTTLISNSSTTTLVLQTLTGGVSQNGYWAVTGTTLPTQAAGTLGIGGVQSGTPTLAANGEGDIYLGTAAGVKFIGKGSSNDFVMANSAGSTVVNIPTGTTNFNVVGGLLLGANNLSISAAAPTVSSGFGSAAAVTHSNGTAAFTLSVGTSNTGTGVIGLPTAATGWVCNATDITTTSTTVSMTKQTASATNSATLQNYSDIAATHAWVDNDVLSISCFGY